MNNGLSNLIQKRNEWINISKANSFNFDSILSGLYNDPSHFVYEILQNAEDAKASTIVFKLDDQGLEIQHDGIDFNYHDVEGITGIGITTKKEDVNAIGKFGVGFKSVFAITQSPVIHSGEYHFCIKDFVVPTVLTERQGEYGTIIELPFDHKIRLREEVFQLVGKKLKDIGLKTLLFLKNIKEMRWQTPDGSGHYYKTAEEISRIHPVKKVSVIAEMNDEEKFEEYIVISEDINIDNNPRSIEVAYKYQEDSDGKIILPESDSCLVVYFPTEKVTFLKFLIQGPYKKLPIERISL